MTDMSIYQTSYDRAQCLTGIVHVGYGAFHRAHQAVYIDEVMEKTGDLSWGIAAINLRASEAEAFQEAASASGGYTVKSIAPDGETKYQLVRSHVGFTDASVQPEHAIDLVSLDSVKLLTITVTESGYYLDKDWRLNLEEEPIAKGLSGEKTETIYAFLAEALAQRADRLNKPITVMCCDNMRSNGHILEQAVLDYIMALGHDTLADWVRENVTFPCSMVDRITPRSTDELTEEISATFPEHATSPVHTETFSQWVIEQKFAAEMPELTQVGVQVVDDVMPFEEAKIRILNGGHTGLAYLGVLSGHMTFDQAMRDPQLGKHFEDLEKGEVLPGLGDMIPFDTSAYLGEIERRFVNQGIADKLERICMDGYSKMAIYIRPTLESCLEKGITPVASFDTIASWIVYARKFKNGHSPVPYHEPYWDALSPMIEPGNEEQLATDPNIWGDLPQRFDCFVPSMVSAIQRMDEKWQA